ncbi:hypothetical protein ACXVUM_02025 [Williamsia sp. SKLECPSW1]
MSSKEFVVDPQSFIDTTRTGLTALGTDEVALIQTLVGEYVASGPRPESRELAPHIAEHFSYVYPRLVADPRAGDCLRKLNAAFGVMDVVPEPADSVMPLARVSDGDGDTGPVDPEPPSRFPWGAAALGAGAAAIAGYYALQALAQYCGDVHPEKGASADVHC